MARPTLPPIHTLNLPRGDIPPPHLRKSFHLGDASSRPATLHTPPLTPSHQTPLLKPVPTAQVHTTYPSPPTPVGVTPTDPNSPKIRLVPASFEEANGVVLIYPRTHPHCEPRSILLVGPSLQRLRLRQYPVPPGSCLRPYHVIPVRPQTGSSGTNA